MTKEQFYGAACVTKQSLSDNASHLWLLLFRVQWKSEENPVPTLFHCKIKSREESLKRGGSLLLHCRGEEEEIG